MKKNYNTFRLALKYRLLELGYPIEISKFYANGRGIRCAGRDVISKNGIRIERERISEYKPSLRIDKYFEYVRVYGNGYIEDDKLKDIVTEVFNEYILSYNIVGLEVTVRRKKYQDNTLDIVNLGKRKSNT